MRNLFLELPNNTIISKNQIESVKLSEKSFTSVNKDLDVFNLRYNGKVYSDEDTVFFYEKGFFRMEYKGEVMELPECMAPVKDFGYPNPDMTIPCIYIKLNVIIEIVTKTGEKHYCNLSNRFVRNYELFCSNSSAEELDKTFLTNLQNVFTPFKYNSAHVYSDNIVTFDGKCFKHNEPSAFAVPKHEEGSKKFKDFISFQIENIFQSWVKSFIFK